MLFFYHSPHRPFFFICNVLSVYFPLIPLLPFYDPSHTHLHPHPVFLFQCSSTSPADENLNKAKQSRSEKKARKVRDRPILGLSGEKKKRLRTVAHMKQYIGGQRLLIVLHNIYA